MTGSIDGDDKHQSIKEIPLSRFRRRDSDATLTSIEVNSVGSLNSPVGFLSITSSLFCAELSIRMQQVAPTAVLHDLVYQYNCINLRKNIGSSVTYPRVPDTDLHKLSIRFISYAGLHPHRDYTCYVAGLVVDGLHKGPLYNIIAW